MAGGAVRDSDKGFKQVLRNISKMAGVRVAIGLQGSEGNAVEHNGKGLTNIDLGIFNEFGVPGANIPERSFVRATFDKKHRSWLNLAVKLSKIDIYTRTPASARRVLGIIGERARADMVRTIDSGIPPALKPATVARKGSSKPLVDTGQLKGAITWAFRK